MKNMIVLNKEYFYIQKLTEKHIKDFSKLNNDSMEYFKLINETIPSTKELNNILKTNSKIPNNFVILSEKNKLIGALLTYFDNPKKDSCFLLLLRDDKQSTKLF